MKRTVFVLLGLAALASLPAGRLQAQGARPWLHVRVEEPQRQVRVEVPLEVVDALLSGEGEALNIQAALKELQKRRGDIVRVNDEKSTVRVWIDEKN